MNVGDVLSRISSLEEQLAAVEGDHKPAKKQRKRLRGRINKLWDSLAIDTMRPWERATFHVELDRRGLSPPPPQNTQGAS